MIHLMPLFLFLTIPKCQDFYYLDSSASHVPSWYPWYCPSCWFTSCLLTLCTETRWSPFVFSFLNILVALLYNIHESCTWTKIWSFIACLISDTQCVCSEIWKWGTVLAYCSQHNNLLISFHASDCSWSFWTKKSAGGIRLHHSTIYLHSSI